MSQLFLGLYAEGATDYQFLRPVIEKTISDIVLNHVTKEVEISVFDVHIDEKGSFADNVIAASSKGFESFGIMALIVHADADSLSAKSTFKHKIEPALVKIASEKTKNICEEIVPVVPIYETESWMLANKSIFKKFILTTKTEVELNIDGHPETMSRPKERIEEAIRISSADLPKKKRGNVTILDLYSIIGESIEPSDLMSFVSYKKFNSDLFDLLRRINYLH